MFQKLCFLGFSTFQVIVLNRRLANEAVGLVRCLSGTIRFSQQIRRKLLRRCVVEPEK